MTDELDKAIKHFGSQTALARAIDPNLSPMAVTHWKKRGLPLRRAHQIVRLTGGVCALERLCPDVFADSA